MTPDGKILVYQAIGGIYSFDLDTKSQVLLSVESSEPRISPDSRMIAFSVISSESQDNELFVMNFDGSGKTDITSKMDTAADHQHNIYPSWSPDGKYIVFHSDNAKDSSTSGDIWRVELSDTTSEDSSATGGTMLFLQVGANVGQNMKIVLTDARTTALGIAGISVVTREQADQAISLLDQAIQKISSERSKYGSYQNALEHVGNNVANYRENILAAAESRIRDADMSKEITELTAHQILLQSSQTMTVQENQMTQGILELLK
ncbi:flagellin [Sporosarcina sp. GW1-11]|uniref:flagellin n=1 Tax=Sporosarcina sp. GW1-11 TaxID=2899126 RepID=UPI002955AA24|nr:flagellin [Sporosarcina sp. GW1-11]